jgi:hypothetical protein
MQKVLIRPIHIESLPFSHTLPVDATAAITLAAGGEWCCDTLDVLFGKLDVYPGAVVLPNRSAGDAFVWYSKLFSYLYRFATVWLDTMHWQPQLGRMGMKVEGRGLPPALFTTGKGNGEQQQGTANLLFSKQTFSCLTTETSLCC